MHAEYSPHPARHASLIQHFEGAGQSGTWRGGPLDLARMELPVRFQDDIDLLRVVVPVVIDPRHLPGVVVGLDDLRHNVVLQYRTAHSPNAERFRRKPLCQIRDQPRVPEVELGFAHRPLEQVVGIGMKIEDDSGLLHKPQPFFYPLAPHPVHIVADVRIVNHLPGAAGNGRSTPQQPLLTAECTWLFYSEINRLISAQECASR